MSAAFDPLVEFGCRVRIGTRDQNAVGPFQSSERRLHLRVVLLARQKTGGLLHVTGVLELQCRRTGLRHPLGRPVDRQRPAIAILDVRGQGYWRSLADTTGDPFDVGEVAEAIVDHAVHRDRHLTAAQHHGGETDHLHRTRGGAIVDARRHDTLRRLQQHLSQ